MNIGLIAHDGKKKLMQNCCSAYRGILSKHDLYSTGTTGRLVEEATGLPVHKLLTGRRKCCLSLWNGEILNGEKCIGRRAGRAARLHHA